MNVKSYLQRQVPILPLAIFRFAFGLLLCISQIRFLAKGWVEELYLAPVFHFTYTGFDWVTPLPEGWMYALVWATALLALFISLGLFYRLSCILFFLAFTYLELIDKAYYLNHYYFVSLMVFLMIWLPANRQYALDRWLFQFKEERIPQWCILVPRLQLGIVYFFAGIAKLKYDWLILGQPLRIWLQARGDLPLIGPILALPFMPILFSWGGMLYDLSIAFLLSFRRTRFFAYIAVIGFHLLTFVLFYIGMFPWIMIVSTLVFFEWKDWKRLFPKLMVPALQPTYNFKPFIQYLLIPYFLIQILLPIRHFFYNGPVLENEKGIRFAWHVMVMEKTGYVEYELTDQETGRSWKAFPSSHLTRAQEKQMSHQKDMIVQYGKFLKENHLQQTGNNCKVVARNWTSLNGRPSALKIYEAKEFK
ncbi:MAG: HTTM domain-containing protein [Bacteroidota bacterium]